MGARVDNAILHQRVEGSLDSLALSLCDQAGEYLDKTRVLGTGQDLLPTVGSQRAGLDGEFICGQIRAADPYPMESRIYAQV